jgi:hypothetical protein
VPDIDPRLGRLPSTDPRRFRPENLMLTALAAAPVVIPRSRIWKPGPILAQDGPTCVANATLAWEMGAQIMDKASAVDTAAVLYAKCQAIDGWPLPHDGTSVEAAMAVMKAEDRLGRYLWAPDEETLWQWVMTQGPAVIGIPWMNSMWNPDKKGFVKVDPASGEAGGHGLKVYGGFTPGTYYYLQNSWGDWGPLHGRFRILRKDMVWLLANGGEACGAIEVKV